MSDILLLKHGERCAVASSLLCLDAKPLKITRQQQIRSYHLVVDTMNFGTQPIFSPRGIRHKKTMSHPQSEPTAMTHAHRRKQSNQLQRVLPSNHLGWSHHNHHFPLLQPICHPLRWTSRMICTKREPTDSRYIRRIPSQEQRVPKKKNCNISHLWGLATAHQFGKNKEVLQAKSRTRPHCHRNTSSSTGQ